MQLHDGSGTKRSTRIENAPPDLYDPNEPRLGRRESEPHSAEVTYIHDVLTSNFPESRTIWDLHHYFIGRKGPLKGQKIDIQFEISFFENLFILSPLIKQVNMIIKCQIWQLMYYQKVRGEPT